MATIGSGTRNKFKDWIWLALPTVLTVGWFFPIVGLSVLVCMIGPLAMAVKKGRYWCGNLCPRGSFFDVITSKWSPGRRIPEALNGKVFRNGMIVFLMGMMSVQILRVWPDPEAIGRVFWRILTVTTGVGVVLALAYGPRTWCGICPVGTMSSWMSKGKESLKVNASCKSCGICAKACPMDLTPHTPNSALNDCIKCGICTEVCPFGSLGFARDAEKVQVGCGG